jgi:hypothetical protein
MSWWWRTADVSSALGQSSSGGVGGTTITWSVQRLARHNHADPAAMFMTTMTAPPALCGQHQLPRSSPGRGASSSTAPCSPSPGPPHLCPPSSPGAAPRPPTRATVLVGYEFLRQVGAAQHSKLDLAVLQHAQTDCILPHAHKAARAIDGIQHPVAASGAAR